MAKRYGAFASLPGPGSIVYPVTGATLVVYIVATTWSGIRGALDDWAPLADWLVAIGTGALAAATFTLAKRAREEAQAVRKESERLGEQARAALRAEVYPESSAEWAQGSGEWAGETSRKLPLRNGGPGLALNVTGTVTFEGVEGRTPLYAGSIAPGGTLNARPRAPLTAGWGKASGELRYSDLNGDEWLTRFRMRMSEGESGQLYVQHDPSELVTAPA
jgi:hypothetical protein